MTRDGLELDPLSNRDRRLRASKPGSGTRQGPQGAIHRIMRGPILDDWHDEAACQGQPTDHWYPEGDSSGRYALAICFRCPVRRECATHALFRPEMDGIWGASTETQRRRVLRGIRTGIIPKEQAVDTLMDISDEDGMRRRLIP